MKMILGKKIGMTQIFADTGEVIPVTVIQAGPEVVTQVKTVETDGYNAVQVGYEDTLEKRVNKPLRGHLAKKIDAVVHFAAMAGVRPSIRNPRLYQEVNVVGTQNVLDLTRDLGAENFILISSSSVYGINPNVPWTERDSVLEPISPYAASKVSCEFLCSVYHHLYKISCTALRLFTVYGPRQRPDLAISKFIARAYDGGVVKLFGDGSSARDYSKRSEERRVGKECRSRWSPYH